MTADGPIGADTPHPLSALLSQLLVAFTIEFDNEFEGQMPHRTTAQGSTSAASVPWLVSMAMWSNCMQFVPETGISAGELARTAAITDDAMGLLLTRMGRWWGYLTVAPDPADARAKPPRSSWLVRPTSAGRRAQVVWEPLAGIVETRWRARFGNGAIDELRGCLTRVVRGLAVALPDYIPVGGPRLEHRNPHDGGEEDRARDGDGSAHRPTLAALLSKPLLAVALEFDAASDLSLAVCANVVRVLDGDGVRVRDLPGLTGLAPMAVDNSLALLGRRHYVDAVSDPAGGRARTVRLAAKGLEAQRTYPTRLAEAEGRLTSATNLNDLGTVLANLVGDPYEATMRLLPGLDPPPGGWRAALPTPQTLPYYPVVSHRGGFPDGS